MEILRERGRALALEVAVEDLADDLRLVLDDRHAVLGVHADAGDVGRVDHQPPALGDLPADPLLAVDARLVVVVRLGYAAVDRRRLTGDRGAGGCPEWAWCATCE
nr:hypothetical protein OH826_30435 [Streptomyces sp. NBC_00899]